MRFFLFVVLALVCVPVLAGDLEIDLANEKAAVELIEARLYTTITIRNAIPGKNYASEVTLSRHQVPAIDFKKAVADVQAETDAGGGGAPRVVAGCVNTARGAAIAALRAAASETDIPSLLQDLRDSIGIDLCHGDSVAENEVESAARETTRTVTAYLPLHRGDIVTLTVHRADDDTLEWTKKFDTGERGRFLTHFGMSFMPDKNNQYFAKQTGDEEFTITRKHERRTADYAPTVFFTWSPEALRGQDVINGPTVGLGFDLENPTAMLGWSWTYNETWGLAVGVAAQRQRRLVGEYAEGDKLKEQLAEDSLTEQTFRPNVFISILWRRGN